jgi:RNA polymerase sigma-70 factor (ECF subfamily)
MGHLGASGEGTRLTRYHLEAGIAACHCLAPSYAQTDWPRILDLYESLRAVADSPVVALNHAIAIAQVHGAGAGLRALERLPGKRTLDKYYLYHAVAGQLLIEAEQRPAAAVALRRALALAATAAERDLLDRKLQSLDHGTKVAKA